MNAPSAPFQFTSQATEDLDAIWWFIAEDNREAADRVEMEILEPDLRFPCRSHSVPVVPVREGNSGER